MAKQDKKKKKTGLDLDDYASKTNNSHYAVQEEDVRRMFLYVPRVV